MLGVRVRFRDREIGLGNGKWRIGLSPFDTGLYIELVESRVFESEIGSWLL